MVSQYVRPFVNLFVCLWRFGVVSKRLKVSSNSFIAWQPIILVSCTSHSSCLVLHFYSSTSTLWSFLNFCFSVSTFLILRIEVFKFLTYNAVPSRVYFYPFSKNNSVYSVEASKKFETSDVFNLQGRLKKVTEILYNLEIDKPHTKWYQYCCKI